MRILIILLVLLQSLSATGQMLVNPYLLGMVPEADYDDHAQAIIDAIQGTGVSLTTTKKDAIDRFVRNAKGIGPENVSETDYWTDDVVYYGFVGGTAAAHAINWKDPESLNITWGGNVTHLDSCVKFNGAGYGNTGMQPGTWLTPDDLHVSFYLQVSGPSGWDLGCGNSSYLTMGVQGTSISFYSNAGSPVGSVATTAAGLFIGSKSGTSTTIHENGVLKITNTVAVGSAINIPMQLGCSYDGSSRGNYSSRGVSFYSVGKSRTSAESTEWTAIVERLQDDLNRGKR